MLEGGEVMTISAKARTALNKVTDKFKSGDLSPIVEIVRLKRHGDAAPSETWSLSNRVLAYIQTGSLDCRTFQQWKKVGRNVKKGAKAAYILGPCQYTVKNEETDEEHQELRGFRGIPEHPFEDTEGDELPQYDYIPLELPPLADVAKRLGVDITWQPLPSDRLGSYNIRDESVKLGTHDTSVFFHELAHAAHDKLGSRLKGGQDAQQETVAEFTAAVLMQMYDCPDRTGNAWQYIQRYNKDPLRAVVSALGTVEKVLALIQGTEVAQ